MTAAGLAPLAHAGRNARRQLLIWSQTDRDCSIARL